MTIKETTATIFITEDGTSHTSREDALEYEFGLAVGKWARSACYTGMSIEDIAGAIVEDRVRLAALFREYVK